MRVCEGHLPIHSAVYSLVTWCSCSCFCIFSKADLVLAKIKQPEVSLSKRCTNSSLDSFGQICLATSISPREIPLPPCTAIPDALLTTISASSSNSTDFRSRSLVWSGTCLSESLFFLCKGGIRTISPVFIRVDAFTRPYLLVLPQSALSYIYAIWEPL